MNKHIFKDTMIMFHRSMKHIFRSIDTIITVCITPIGLMLLFVYVFSGAMGGGMTTSEYITYSLPGILLISIASGISYVAVRLFMDMQNGFFDRFKSMPIAASSALWAHVLTALVSNGLTITIITLFAYLIGFRSSAGFFNWILIIAVLTIFTLALIWIAIFAGLKASSVEGSYAFSYPLVFLPFISSAFVPTTTMPYAVRVFAEHQPVTAIVNSLRTLLMNERLGSELWVALSWCVGTMFIAWFFAMRSYRKRI